jgi:hypothetical protein
VATSVVACGRGASSPAVSGRNTTPAPTTPAPSIEFRDASFVTSGLPAIARDGGLVVVPMVESDGGRGFPNLRIEVRDRSDRLTRRIDVMAASEYETLVPDGTRATPALGRRMLAANEVLTRLHTSHELLPMRATAAPRDLAIDFAASGWLAPVGRRCAQCPLCENPPYLDAVFEADGSDVLLVRIAYRGTDLCWEPSPQYHVIVR